MIRFQSWQYIKYQPQLAQRETEQMRRRQTHAINELADMSPTLTTYSVVPYFIQDELRGFFPCVEISLLMTAKKKKTCRIVINCSIDQTERLDQRTTSGFNGTKCSISVLSHQNQLTASRFPPNESWVLSSSDSLNSVTN